MFIKNSIQPGILKYRVLFCLMEGIFISLALFYSCASKRSTTDKVTDVSGQKTKAEITTQPRDEYYSSDQVILAKGQQLFETNCSACHNFLQKGIGPNLGQVTSQVPAAWLVKFIQNAPQVINSGDNRAQALFDSYKQYMPPFTGLSNTDIQAILSYIHKNQQVSTAATSEYQGTMLKDPIPVKIKKSGLRLSLEEITTAPATAEKIPLARINKMLTLPGKPNRLFIEDLRGILYEMKDKQLHPFMNISQERPGFIHTPGLATGFGSYAFHPDFYKNGLLYTTHTEKAHAAPADFAYADSIKVTLQWVLTEWKMENPGDQKFFGRGREMLRVNLVSNIHGVQEITFNPLAKPGTPDFGMLYIGIGDGGASENGYYFVCNSKKSIWSSVLRINPTGKNSRNGQYGIPDDNPFAKDTDPATVKEIYCRGFRNPNRICWTPDGKMLITDIGHANAEEVNIGIGGADYGWPDREGTFVINHRGKMDHIYALPEDDAAMSYTYPVAQYDHDEGKAISGGFVYAGKAIPLLTGKYIFGDIVNGRVFYVENKELKLGNQAPVHEFEIQVGGKISHFQELSGSKKTDLRFGMGINNELYLYTKADGKIYQVVDCTMAN